MINSIDKVNVGVIGMGYWGPNILRALLKNKKCKVLKVVDLSKSRLKYINQLKKNILTSHDINFIIKDKSINSVFICTPAKTHFKIAKKCLLNKKNVFVEKPIATNFKDTKELFKISKKKKLLLMAGDQYIYNSAITRIKKLIDTKKIGKIYYFNFLRMNLGRIREDVDVKLNLSTHDISILQYLMDYELPIEVKNIDYKVLKRKLSDASIISLKYKNNIYANINVSWIYPEKVRKITIIGSKKMIIYDDLIPGKIYLINKSILPKHINNSSEFDQKYVAKFEYLKKKSKIINYNVKEPIKIEIEHFFKSLNIEKQINLTGKKHCLSIMKIINKFKN